MPKQLTLGSLFDGSGGFPLAGLLNGVKPVWASEIEPFPIRVTTKRLPWMKHYGDISAINGAEVEPVDILTFGSPCFPEGTLVLTERGLVDISEVEVGDKVLTHKCRYRTVTAVGAKLANTVVLRGNHNGLECTPNHPIYCLGGEDGTRWVPAEDMQAKLWGVPNKFDQTVIPYPVPPTSRIKPMPELNEELFYFVGRWLGDGWVRNAKRTGRPEGQRFATIFLCDSKDKLPDLEKTVRAVSENYSIEYCETCVKVKCNGRLLCDWLTENFGSHAYGKTIPAWALSLPDAYRVALLNGIIDSDGYVKDDRIRVTTVSKKLAVGIRLLAESLGKTTSVYYTKTPDTYRICGREVNQRDTYTVEIRTREQLSAFGVSWYKVKSVTPTKETKVVYNMTVDEDNSYTADGIIVHNCQDLSVAGKRAGLQDGDRSHLFYQAIRIAKEMRKATNGEYPKYLVFENVAGAFSSNIGEDFRCVLQAFCSICDDSVSVPRPVNGKWRKAGAIVGRDHTYAVGWRALNAMYWGVPQRRERVFAVVSLTDASAANLLFESESLSGNSAESRRPWERFTRTPEAGTGTTGTRERV